MLNTRSFLTLTGALLPVLLSFVPTDELSAGRVGATAELGGSVFEDRNANGARDRDEPGLPGVTVYIDVNSNGVLDRSDRVTRTGTISNDSGEFWFTDLIPGEYVIREVVPEGFEQTFPLPIVRMPAPVPAALGTVTPGALGVRARLDEVTVRRLSFTVEVACVRAFDLEVRAPEAPAGMVRNLTGLLTNGCSGDTSSFDVEFTGDGGEHTFDLLIAEPGSEQALAIVPVRVVPEAPPGYHLVTVGEGEGVEGIDFGNQRVDSVAALQLPGDCNQDGALDISDGVCLLAHLFTGVPAVLPCGDGTPIDPANVSLLDANGDTSVDVSDGIHVFGFLFSGGPPHVLGTRCVPIRGCADNCAP